MQDTTDVRAGIARRMKELDLSAHTDALVADLMARKDLDRVRALAALPPKRVRGVMHKLLPPKADEREKREAGTIVLSEILESPHLVAIGRIMRYDERRLERLANELLAKLSEKSMSEANVRDVVTSYVRRYPLPYTPPRKR